MIKRGFTFREPTEEDIRFLVEHMRESDRREVKRWTGQGEEYEVRYSIATSRKCYAGVFSDGKVACIFGAAMANLIEGEAVIWMLSTDEVDRHRVEFLAGSKAALDRLGREMTEVESFYNWVDLGYEAAGRWLEHLGFGRAAVAARPGFRGGEFGVYQFANPHYRRD